MLKWLAWGELVTLVVLFAAGLAVRAERHAWLRRAARAWEDVARRRRLAVVGVGLLAFLVNALASSSAPPVPRAHDEFGYLLLADTFASGRLSNPTHPMWPHFETFHVIHQPSYAAKFPPAPALPLALAQRLLGHVVVGIWLSTALAAAAVCWMLQGWMPSRWALVGGLLVALHLGVQMLWGQGYWGGAVAMAGAALAFGAFARIVRGPRPRDAVILALGVAVLANSRPLEGAVVSLALAVGLGVELLVRRRHALPGVALRLVVPGGLVLVLAAAAMAFYNLRVTGDPLRTPYQVHEALYGATPLVLWQPLPAPPAYRHAVVEDFHLGFEQEPYLAQRTLGDVARTKGSIYARVWLVFVRPSLTLPLLFLPFVLRRRSTRLPAVALALVLATSLAVPWLQAHYLAPAAPAFFLLVVAGLRRARTLRWRERPVGRLVLPAVLAVQVAILALALGVHLRTEPAGWHRQKARLLARLESRPERDLVVVRYGADHDVHAEWVFNRADLDAAPVLWAREMGPQQDRALVDHFGDRRAWLLLADERPPKLVPHPARPER